ncbi:MAG: ribonuclease P protein component [Thermodesulfobacteriota bacterium]
MAPSPGQRPQTAVSLIFPRGFKITSRSDYQICYSRGRRFLARNFIVFVLPVAGQHWRLGIAASRKTGNAVKRNRIKRLVREVFRVNQHEIGLEADIVVVVKRAAPIPELNYYLVRDELLPLLDRITARIGRNGFNK